MFITIPSRIKNHVYLRRYYVMYKICTENDNNLYDILDNHLYIIDLIAYLLTIYHIIDVEMSRSVYAGIPTCSITTHDKLRIGMRLYPNSSEVVINSVGMGNIDQHNRLVDTFEELIKNTQWEVTKNLLYGKKYSIKNL